MWLQTATRDVAVITGVTIETQDNLNQNQNFSISIRLAGILLKASRIFVMRGWLEIGLQLLKAEEPSI